MTLECVVSVLRCTRTYLTSGEARIRSLSASIPSSMALRGIRATLLATWKANASEPELELMALQSVANTLVEILSIHVAPASQDGRLDNSDVSSTETSNLLVVTPLSSSQVSVDLMVMLRNTTLRMRLLLTCLGSSPCVSCI